MLGIEERLQILADIWKEQSESHLKDAETWNDPEMRGWSKGRWSAYAFCAKLLSEVLEDAKNKTF
jgi:hypothetical protein